MEKMRNLSGNSMSTKRMEKENCILSGRAGISHPPVLDSVKK